MAFEIQRRGRNLMPQRPRSGIEDLERLFEDWAGAPLLSRLPATGIEWAPPLEMYDQENKLVVRAELPGMKEEDVDVSVTDSTLTLKGERKTTSEAKEEDYQFSEMSYGSFSRSITLPSNIDTGNITATFDNGILQVDLPKSPEQKPTKIPITSGKSKKS